VAISGERRYSRTRAIPAVLPLLLFILGISSVLLLFGSEGWRLFG
jgi:hypothetical protein